MSQKTFYITTTLPYVNAEPHLGHALEFVRADVLARYKKIQGYDVFFNTGTDEHGQKIYTKAQEAGHDTQSYVDKYAERFKGLIKALGLLDDINFIRTSDSHHKKSAQEFWQRCLVNGDIYKKQYQTKYCVGCELEKTDSELINGKCPDHINNEIELRNEENYFFKFSKYQKPLLDLYQSNPKFVIPDFRFNEIKSFVERGLEDFSISRLKTKMPWGIAVPGDDTQVMYVWFDALVNYISTLGWPEDNTKFEKYWINGTPTQYCGKDNLRQQSAMWQAMLLSAGIPTTNTIIINGFITGPGGVKMSKSIGNVVSPYELIEDYGTEAFRYFVLREVNSFEDTEFTKERFKETYNANLANGLGNLVSRVMKMASTNLEKPIDIETNPESYLKIEEHMNQFDFKKAMDYIFGLISQIDESIQKEQPFKVVKVDKEKGVALIENMVSELLHIANLSTPFLPETSKYIKELIVENKMPDKPLFARKD